VNRKNTRTISVALAVGGMTLLLCMGCTKSTSVPEPSVASPPQRPIASPSVFDGTLRDAEPVPEISTAELQAALKDAGVVVLDARPYAEYAVSHLPGARSVPGKPGTTPALYTADAADILQKIPDRSRQLVLYCNGLFCGRSKRFGAELQKLGYTNVRRYQLGIPAWRALGGVTQVEKDALVSLLKHDATAVLVDARETVSLEGRLANARSIPLRDAPKAKDDGRLPMTDHNTRIFVVGESGPQARAVAEAIVRDAFHNVSFFAGTLSDVPELAEKDHP
jgi:rhodanese-related sulfurtransferase